MLPSRVEKPADLKSYACPSLGDHQITYDWPLQNSVFRQDSLVTPELPSIHIHWAKFFEFHGHAPG